MGSRARINVISLFYSVWCQKDIFKRSYTISLENLIIFYSKSNLSKTMGAHGHPWVIVKNSNRPSPSMVFKIFMFGPWAGQGWAKPSPCDALSHPQSPTSTHSLPSYMIQLGVSQLNPSKLNWLHNYCCPTKQLRMHNLKGLFNHKKG
jgi:hypothetical protein